VPNSIEGVLQLIAAGGVIALSASLSCGVLLLMGLLLWRVQRKRFKQFAALRVGNEEDVAPQRGDTAAAALRVAKARTIKVHLRSKARSTECHPLTHAPKHLELARSGYGSQKLDDELAGSRKIG